MKHLNTSNLWKEIHEQPACVETSLRKNEKHIKKIAQQVKKRKINTVVFAARGSSEHAAVVARYLFEHHCHMIASIALPSVITCYRGMPDYSHTLVIGISQSGGAKDVAAVMEHCMSQGGLCVSITNEHDSLMSKIGHIRINNECGPEISITAAKSYITQLVLLCQIAAVISEDAELSDAMSHAKQAIAYALTLENSVRAILPYYRNAQHMLLFGRGLLYGLAQESELKIQETCYLDARAYAASDYQHGPIASTNSFVPAIFFIADKNTNESIFHLAKRMKKEYHVGMTMITNDPEIAKLGDNAILFDERYDGLPAVFVCAVLSQMFACMLSFERGYQPDNPVGVSKHTVTY